MKRAGNGRLQTNEEKQDMYKKNKGGKRKRNEKKRKGRIRKRQGMNKSKRKRIKWKGNQR